MSSRTSGPTITRAPRGLRLGERRQHVAVAVPDHERLGLGGVGRGEEPGLHGLGRATERLPDASGSTSTMGPGFARDLRDRRPHRRCGAERGDGSRRRLARRADRFACRRSLRGGQCRQSEREARTRTRHGATALPSARIPEAAGRRSYERSRFRMDEGGRGGRCGRRGAAARFSRRREHYMWLPRRSEICAI